MAVIIVVLHLELFIQIFRILLELKVFDFSYFVTFIGDSSRITWLFLMKITLKFSQFFQKNHKEISTQFNCSFKTLRSDNTLEYVQYALRDYCVSHDIIH